MACMNARKYGTNNRLSRLRQIETCTDSPQLRAELEKLKRLVDAHPKGLNTTFKITKRKRRSNISTRPRRKLFAQGLPSYFLFEFASGYALFHGHGVDDLPLSRYDVHEKYINRTDQIFKLKAFYPFSSSADALIQMIAISNSTVTPQLKSFLVDNLPKTIHGKGSSCLVATSNTLLAHNIGITTRLGVRCGGFCDNFMRGLRMKIDKFIDGLEPKDLEKQRLNLAHLYSRQRCTTMVAKSSKAITPRGKKRCPSMVVRSSKAIAPTSLQQFVVVPHKFEGVFIAQGKEEDFICTRNLVPGEALYDEELIYIQNEDGTDVEYRVWNPLRSKLGAAILCGVKNICVKPGSRILYLGDVCEITVSHLSDLVGSDGLVYVVGISDVVVNMLEKRPNVITIIEKPMLCWNYRMVLGMVDVIFADIAYPIANPYQGHWFFINAKFYLRAGGHYMISTRENNINGLHTNFDFQREFNPIELVKLEPIVRESVLDVGSYRVPNEAVYHGPDIFLLDDVLSAVDAEVAQWILSNAILGPLMNQKTRILCTHNVQIGVALYLLYTQVKLAFVAGTAITILLIPVNKWIAKAVADATRSMMKQKDERIRRAGELLTYIRTLKMYGWELLFFSWLMKARSSEVTFLSTRKYLDAWCVFFWATTPTLFSFCTFGLYALMGNQLDAATVFTCLALFNNLISPLNSFPWVINGLIDAIISASHLSRFLCCPEIETETSSDNYLSSCTDEYPCVTGEDVAVVINEACCLWSSNDQEQLVMDHVSLSLSKGHLVAVVGEVGSGKSSLLSCILRETRIIKGFVYLGGSIAYVPQVPWILSGSIRDNVVLGDEYDPRRLSDILKACAMDIDVSRMNGGDMAFIGVKGVNLSGGQRARLALARAVYHGPDIFLLDDVLSAVDAEVAQWILSNAILGPLMNQKTRILCTHNVQAISSADTVVLIDKGQVRWVGSPSSFSISSYIAPSLREDFIISSKVQNQDKDVDAQEKVLMDSEDIHVLEEAPYSLEVEQRKEGRVELVTYKNYAAFCGWSITILTCLSAIFMQASRNGNDVWLSYWVDTTGYQTSFYLVVLCIFCVVNSSLTLVRAFSFAFGGLRAAVQVHDRLLKNLVNAPVQFFDQTPSGRKLNRLSSDLYTIDETLPFILNILLANFVGLLGIAIVLSYVQVMFLLLLLPFWYIYNKLQFYYRSTSRELRRLDSVSRSPIYDSFTEILNGSSTIRAFKTEDVFFARFTEKVILYQRTSYSETIANLWLSLRLQLLAAVIVSFVAVMAVVGSHGHLLISFGSPGKVGLALSYAAPVVSLLGNFLTSFTETEKELVSVERVLQYMDIAQEELHGCHLDTDWPLHGNIEFLNVTLQYMPSLPAALCDITCTFSAGTQTGIVGRTGAGKSSILNVLFRLNPLSGGCILVDGINIANISLRDLRSRFSVVPQTPFLFEGSLRDNLDPFRVNDDLKIWDSLAKCQVEEEVKAMGGLDMHVKESGTPFSVGQRQLLCLARAFLKSSKVLCLDECTANVDTSTALKLQNAITSKCRGITVITIAHRIPTVLNMDTIVILDQGSLVEQGNPQALVQDKMSRFSSFVKASSTRN